ncbi:MAG: alkaline phosphatase family protein [Fidelibacterota bacterium]|jgi:ectonucleotide pyrophosphatase/phosphodiesterase family protein 5|tara:strand:- start:1162 stop:2424 length:1263 start_codon:yes stop_codon:yes gene_type:complete
MKKVFTLNFGSYRLYFLLMAVFFSFNACKNDTIIAGENPLILISMDGFRWDYFDKTETPNFDELISGGSKSAALIPSFPTKTFPNHITIVTGNYPENHGIVANRMYDNLFDEYYYIGEGSKPVLDGKWYEAEPIWVTAEKQGKRAMTMFWPASEAEIMGVRPTEYFVYDGSVPHDDRIDQILEWVDYPPEKRPAFISTYFSHTDDYGHRYGPDSKEILQAIGEMDRAMGRLIFGLKVRGLFEKVNILLVSDHGMAKTSSDSMIFLDDLIDMSLINIIDGTPVAAIQPLEDLDSIYNILKNSNSEMDIYKKGETPKRLHYNNHRRIQPLTLSAKEHWSISTKDYFIEDDHAQQFNGATHGYDPKYISMRGVFLAHGPAFKKNFIGPGISNIHLYEMMCKIIGISPANNDGVIDSTAIFLKY